MCRTPRSALTAPRRTSTSSAGLIAGLGGPEEARRRPHHRDTGLRHGFPWGDSGFSSLCGDGSLTNVLIAKHDAAQLTHTKPFFDTNNDPIYDNGFVNPKTGDAVFLSYTGLVYEARLGPTP